jgi:hypothetical protein
MIVPKPEHGLGKAKEPVTFRGANNAIWNKINFALSLVGQKNHEKQLTELLNEARALADSVVHHPQADLPTFVCCNVLFAHCREIKGQTMMLEPLLSGNVWLPYDEDTKLALKKKWLKFHEP